MVLCLQMAAQTWEEVKVGTSTRKTLTYVPKNVEKSPALVISLHGMNQDPEYQQKQTQWNAMADKEGFIVTYPLANNKMWDTSGMGDVKFVEAIMSIILVIYTHLDIWGWLSQFHLDCNIVLVFCFYLFIFKNAQILA